MHSFKPNTRITTAQTPKLGCTLYGNNESMHLLREVKQTALYVSTYKGTCFQVKEGIQCRVEYNGRSSAIDGPTGVHDRTQFALIRHTCIPPT